MKRNFLPNNIHTSRRPSVRKTLGIFACIALFLLLVFLTPLRNGLSGLLAAISRPFWSGENEASIFVTREQLSKENTELKDRVRALEALELENELLRTENENLKKIFGVSTSTEQMKLSYVLVRPAKTLYDTLVIEGGRDRGYRIGDKVYADGAVLLGTIGEVNGSTSKVSLYSSPGTLTSVLIGTGNIPAEAEGRGGQNFRVRLPEGIDVKEGDTISLPGDPLHVIGLIYEVAESGGDESLQTAYGRSPRNMQTLPFVFVSQ